MSDTSMADDSFSFVEPRPRFPHTRAQLAAIARAYARSSQESELKSSFGNVDEDTVSKVVIFLEDEKEDEMKAFLKDKYGVDDEEQMEQHVLDLMHKHRDDISNVPFLFLTPTPVRRPPTRPSSRASNHSLSARRPETPTTASAPSSPLALVFRRPHTPLTSPLGQGQLGGFTNNLSQGGSYLNKGVIGDSRSSSPVSFASHASQAFASSLPSSPLSSPRLLNAKATEFKPSGSPRPLSSASTHYPGIRAETPSPDLWAHNPLPQGTASPHSRPSSKLAIAAPLIPDTSLLPRAITPSSSLRSSMRPEDDDDDDDPFDPFAASKSGPRTFYGPTTPLEIDLQNQWANSPNSSESLSTAEEHFNNNLNLNLGYSGYDASLGLPPMDQLHISDDLLQGSPEDDEEEMAAMLTDGMTPFDVLSSVFGATLAPSELEEALEQCGWDFERAMAWLVDRTKPSQPQQPQAAGIGRGVAVVGKTDQWTAGKGVGPGNNNGKFGGSRNVSGGGRVCRYFLAGECLRADCRFSHDLERALCRFWLRGTCAKMENCEFLHRLPDPETFNVIGRNAQTQVQPQVLEEDSSPPPEEFPALGTAAAPGAGRGGIVGSHATRFAQAVKKGPGPSQLQKQGYTNGASMAAKRAAMGTSADTHTSIIAPKPSPRLNLRPPTLLPTLPTGVTVNQLYMTYRQRALQLGQARNACLSRAADAWRRGDGAAAKRFGREGAELNGKMKSEMTEAAGRLVRERARVSEAAVKENNVGLNGESAKERGKKCGGGLGVILGVVSGTKGTMEERTECMLDLHGLHANEATEILEEFLLALEAEHYYGLAYLVVGEEKHTGTQDKARGASRARLAAGVKQWLHQWGYPWSERDGIICVDPLTHA